MTFNTKDWLHRVTEKLIFFPFPSQYYYIRGLRFSIQGHLDKSIESFTQAIKLRPKESDFYMARARAKLKIPQIEEALEDVKRVLGLRPRLLDAKNLELNLLYLLKRYQEVADAPISAEPFEEELLLKKIKHAKSVYEMCVKSVAFSKANFRVVRCRAFYRLNRINEAEYELNEAFLCSPEYPVLFTWRAFIFYSQGRYDEAKAAYEKVLELNENSDAKEAMACDIQWNTPAENNFAWFLATCPADSIRDGDRALKMAFQARKDNKRILSDTLAACYAEVGQFEEAISHQKKHLEECDSEEFSRAQELLSCFMEGKPYRTPPGPLKINNPKLVFVNN